MIAYKTWLYPIVLLTALTLSACGGGGGSSAPGGDETPPVFSSINPGYEEEGVSINASVTVTFSENLDCTAPYTVVLTQNGNSVDGERSCDGSSITFKPTSVLDPGTLYSITVADVADAAGNTLVTPVVSSFTCAAIDSDPPTVKSTVPANDASFVNPQLAISAVFNESLSSSTINATTFKITGPSGGNVAGTTSYVDATKKATFTPSNALMAGSYTATLSTGITDLDGNALPAYSWSFTVSTAPILTAPPSFSANFVETASPLGLKLYVTPNASKIKVCMLPVPAGATPLVIKKAAVTVELNACSEVTTNSTGATTIDVNVNTAGFQGVFYPTVEMWNSGSVSESPDTFYSYLPQTSPVFYTIGVGSGAVASTVPVPVVVVGSAPDLQIKVTSVTLNGTDLRIDYEVKNIGTAVSGAANIDFFRDSAAAPVVGQNGVRTTVPALAVNLTESQFVVVPFVSAVPSVVYALVDSSGVVIESDESNNVATWVNPEDPQKIPFVSSNVPLAIPTFGPVSSSLQVTSAINSLRYVAVKLDITHPVDQELTLTLISPVGTAVILSNKRGGTGDNYSGTLFHDGAAIAIAAGTPPFNGAFSPDIPLAALNGENPNGLWTLKVNDDTEGDGGVLNSWSLRLW
ncbi:MAG: hypothetical protein CVU69_05740 [Deltaproteobacteria bacterium HGW-Deltaproteobacteria-4]|nr:MAG: hypothetical protein CVU69_05740 [Deltaproteobacteria bacterium HGW-Deltaproteobacteria-4]